MKFIIHNSSPIDDLAVITLVHQVTAGGLVSDFGKSYCYCTTFTDKETSEVTLVTCHRNKSGSFTFNVMDNTI